MNNPAELLKKYILGDSKPVYLSSDENFIVFERHIKFPANDPVQMEMRDGVIKFQLPLLTVWKYLKFLSEEGGAKDPTLGFRDRIQLKEYFFKREAPPKLKPDLFTPPLQTTRKRDRTIEESSYKVGMGEDSFFEDVDSLRPAFKKRKLSAEEEESREHFWRFIDDFSRDSEEKTNNLRAKFKTIKGVEEHDVGYTNEFDAFVSQDNWSEDSMNQLSSDLCSTKLYMDGGSYNRFTDFEFASKTYQSIRREEKALEEYYKKNPRARKRQMRRSQNSRPSKSENKNLVKKPPPPSGVKSPSKSSSKSGKVKNLGSYRHVVKRTEPIIVVPGQITALLTIYNAQLFLEKWTFQTSEECRKETRERPKYVRVKHINKQNKTTVFRIYDNVKHLKDSDWIHVCAIFTNGKVYEFRNFPTGYKNDITRLFSKIAGFHVCYHGARVDDNVKKWPIRLLTIDRTSRSRDKSAAAEFWKIVDP